MAGDQVTMESKEEMLSGFQINYIKLRDAATGIVLWTGYEDYSSNEKYWEIKLPKAMFKHKDIAREINFSSTEYWNNLKIKQIITYKGIVIEELNFEYGEVLPNTINTWVSVITKAPEADLMPPEILSGNIVVISKFYNEETLISRSCSRVFYVD